MGSYQANAYGVHDALGNVWEWVQDCWQRSYRGAPRDGGAWEAGDCSRRTMRGGPWNNSPRDLRAAVHVRIGTDDRDYNVGFRVARPLAR